MSAPTKGPEAVNALLGTLRLFTEKSFYKFWLSGPLEDYAGTYMNPVGVKDLTAYMIQNGGHCSGILNAARWWNWLPAVGGVPAYGQWMVEWEPVEPGKPIEVGKVLWAPYTNARLQGHVAIVSTPPDENGNQWCIQSDAVDWVSSPVSWGTPGPNEKRTVAETIEMFGMTHVGVMPDVGYIPFEGGRQSARHGGLSADELFAAMPSLAGARAVSLLPHLCRAMWEADITTVGRKAAFLAQLGHESVDLRHFEEIADGSAYEGRRDLGNIFPGDGRRYKGRGPIQLTGRANYRTAGSALGLDLEGNPEQAATPGVGFRVAAWYWTSRGLNALADVGNFDAITYRINGGYNGYQDRVNRYHRSLKAVSPYSKGGDLLFGKYNLCAAPDSPVDKRIATAAKIALEEAGIPAPLITTSSDIDACSMAAYWGETGAYGCLVVGAKTHEHLNEKDKPFDGWVDGWDTWQLWDPKDKSATATVRRVRDLGLTYIEKLEKKQGKVIPRFDQALKALGGTNL